MLSSQPLELRLCSGDTFRLRAPDRRVRHFSCRILSRNQLPIYRTVLRSEERGQYFPVAQVSRCLVLYSQCHLRGRKERSRVPFAASNDGFSANSGPYAKSPSDDDLAETRTKLNASLQVNDTEVNSGQALHEAARKFQLAMERRGSLRRGGWFAKSWLGVDHISWIKPLAYQAAVHALLQAVLEIASRGEGRDRDAHIFVQRSILRQLAPLEESINRQFSYRSFNAEEWFWSQQHPVALSSFVDMLERDSRFTAVTSIGWEGASVCPSKATDVTLITLATDNAAAVLKLGAAKLSCPPFFSTLTEEICRLMSMLAEFIPIDQVYSFTSGVGLRDHFLRYFGQQAAIYRDEGEIGGEEGAFWVDLVQQLLRGALIREHIRTKLTSYDSIEVLERDLAVFGFFACLGRRTRLFLVARNISDSDEQLAGLLRYLIGASVLFYPQLSSLNTYQIFIEVVSEEMEWLPLYPTSPSMLDHGGHQLNEKIQMDNNEAIFMVLDNCSRWIGDFMKYSTWAQQPAGVRAATFLSTSQTRLDVCLKDYPTSRQRLRSNKCRKDIKDGQFNGASGNVQYQERWSDAMQGSKWADEVDDGFFESSVGRKNVEAMKRSSQHVTGNESVQKMEHHLQLFDKELQGVDEALRRLECLLEPEMGPGKQHLTVACVNLEKVRQLKKEVETLETSLRKKATSILQAQEKVSVQPQRRQKGSRERSYPYEEGNDSVQGNRNRTNNLGNMFEGMKRFFPFIPNIMSGTGVKGTMELSSLEDEAFEQAAAAALQEASTVSNEIQRFELLRQELMDLEMRIQECAEEHSHERENMCQVEDGGIQTGSSTRLKQMSNEADLREDIFSKSLLHIKETTTDVWRGTQLLATDVAAAMVLLKRSASGEELTEREKKVLKRTMTDLASVIPIGFLMLLPVTAVGHAAILAAIQRYVPALIPSTYARERLDLMRQLEQVRELETADVCKENALASPDLAIKRGAKKDI